MLMTLKKPKIESGSQFLLYFAVVANTRLKPTYRKRRFFEPYINGKSPLLPSPFFHFFFPSSSSSSFHSNFQVSGFYLSFKKFHIHDG